MGYLLFIKNMRGGYEQYRTLKEAEAALAKAVKEGFCKEEDIHIHEKEY